MLAQYEANLIGLQMLHPPIKQPMFLNGKIAPSFAINTDSSKIKLIILQLVDELLLPQHMTGSLNKIIEC